MTVPIATLPTLPMLQWPEEVAAFLAWLDTVHPRRIVEIGTGPGGLTQELCRRATQVISVDLPMGASTGSSQDACERRNASIAAEYRGFVGILGDSHDPATVARVNRALAGHPADLLFLDGDHHYEGVKADWANYMPLVRRGGWVGFHDINAVTFGDEVQVRRFWDELSGTKQEFSAGGHWGGIGLVQV